MAKLNLGEAFSGENSKSENIYKEISCAPALHARGLGFNPQALHG